MRKTQLQLSDAQQSTIIRAGYALEPAARELLRGRVLETLAHGDEPLGDGTVFRACREAQRQLWQPPGEELRYRHGPYLFRKSG